MAVNYEKRFFHKQKERNDCWFASFLMVRDMVKQEVSDYQEQKESFIQDRNIISDEQVAKDLFITGADDVVLREILQKLVDRNYEIGWNADIGLVNKGLSTGKPVIMGVDYQSGGGHFVVVIGADTKTNRIVIVDPLGNGEPEERNMPGNCNIHYYKA